MELTKIKCPENKYNIKCPNSMIGEFYIVHNTANDASAMSEVSYMLGNANTVSFHYAIDDYRIVQGIEENRNTWNCGDGSNGNGNRHGISIETCYSKSGGDKFTLAEILTAEFIARGLDEKSWGIDKVKKHQDFNGKYCPHRTLDIGWQRFLNLIISKMDNRVVVQVAVPINKHNVNEVVTYSSCYKASTSGVNEAIILKSWQKGTITRVLPGTNNPYLIENGRCWINNGDIRDIIAVAPVPVVAPQKKWYARYKTNATINVHSIPDDGNVTRLYKQGTIFDIYEEKNGFGHSPSGWVKLSYCTKI